MSMASRSSGMDPLSAVMHTHLKVRIVVPQIHTAVEDRRSVQRHLDAAAPEPCAAGHERARTAVQVVGDADDPAEWSTVRVDDAEADQPVQFLRVHTGRLCPDP